MIGAEPINAYDLKGMLFYIKKTMHEKTKKVKKSGKLGLFHEWWLILRDYYLIPVPYTDPQFVREVQRQASFSYPWSRVILIHKEIFRPEVWFTDQEFGLEEPEPTKEDFWTDIRASILK